MLAACGVYGPTTLNLDGGVCMPPPFLSSMMGSVSRAFVLSQGQTRNTHRPRGKVQSSTKTDPKVCLFGCVVPGSMRSFVTPSSINLRSARRGSAPIRYGILIILGTFLTSMNRGCSFRGVEYGLLDASHHVCRLLVFL